MIRYSPETCTISIDGHAGAGEAGKDIVCAAVSAVAYTLAGNLRRLEEEGVLLESRVEMAVGHAEIGGTGKGEFQDTVRIIFEAVCLGFFLISEQYPEFVRLEVCN